MNDRFFVSVSVRVRMPDNSRAYFLGRLTTEKGRFRLSWRVQKVRGILTADALSVDTVRKYSLQTFPNKDLVRDLARGIAEYFAKNNQKRRNIFAAYFKNFLSNRAEDFGIPERAEIDWAQEIIGEIKQ